MKTKTEWTPSDLTNAKAIGNGLSMLEFRDIDGEWHDFHVLELPDRIVFGGACNTGFLESGYILRDDCESLDETLSELLADLECYYNNGPHYVSRIVCNERM